MEEPTRVLVVSEPDEAARVAEGLEQVDDGFEGLTATSVTDGLDRLAGDAVDCVVSDYDLPQGDGLAFLEAVREAHPHLPFILLTRQGGDAVASDAIAAGVTDYLPVQDGLDEIAVLAARVRNAVAEDQVERAVHETEAWFSTLLEHSSDFLFVVDDTGTVSYVSPSVERVLGYAPDEVTGTSAFEFTHPDDVEQAMDAFQETLERPREAVNVAFRARHADGSLRRLDVRGRNLLDDPVVEGIIVNARDVTDRQRHEQELKRQNERLAELASILSHDLRNPLAVAKGNLEIARAERDAEELANVERALERMDELIDSVLAMTRLGQTVSETEPFWLSTLAEECWANVATAGGGLTVESDRVIEGHRGRLKQVLENLFRNAVEHGGPEVTVHVGALEDGFFVEDDGPGIPAERLEQVFEPGYTTTDDGTGLGLNIVAEVIQAHGWKIAVTEGNDGGARFEITGFEVEA